MALTRTDIEFLKNPDGTPGYGWTFYTGCEHWKRPDICPVGPKCWAKGNYDRFGRDFTLTLHPEKLLDPFKKHRKEHRTIGVCFTGDLFGEWVTPHERILGDLPSGAIQVLMSLRGWLWTTVNQCPADTFVFLTKRPGRLALWSPFPPNAAVGVTVCNQKMLIPALEGLATITAGWKYLIFEPLMERIELDYKDLWGIDGVILGGWSRETSENRIPGDWTNQIVQAADDAGARLYVKENIIYAMRLNDFMRRELPWGKAKERK